MSIDLQQDRALRASRYPIDDLVKAVKKEGYSRIVGARGGFLPIVIADLVKRLARPTVVVVPDSSESRVFYEALSSGTTLGADRVSFLPPPEISPYAGVSPDRQTTLDRVTALASIPKLAAGDAMVTSALGWARRSAPAAALEACSVSLSIDDDEVDTDVLAATLVAGGYSGVGLVEDPGTFSVRGDIVDIFPAGAEFPYRVELYGDMVESIRRFDPETQRGVDDADRVEAGPAVETLLTPDSLASLRERLGDLAESLHVPSSRVGAVLRDLRAGVRFFGIESLLPAFHASPRASLTVCDVFPSASSWPIHRPIFEQLRRASELGRRPPTQIIERPHNLDKLSCAERSEGTGSACPDDIAAGTCLRSAGGWWSAAPGGG